METQLVVEPANTQRIILASGSAARRAMLQSAGLTFDVIPSNIDEEAVRYAFQEEQADAAPADIAEILACAKAADVSASHPDALVIGADQVLSFGREIVTKSEDMAAARSLLRSLRGKTHHLHSTVALAQNGKVWWTHGETTNLKMRPLSDEFIDQYLAACRPGILSCVGAYQIEGLGAQLFDEINGDYFNILGLPLLPLLAELRNRKVMLS